MFFALVNASRKSNWDVPVAVMIRAQPRSWIALRTAADACSAAALLRESLSSKTLTIMLVFSPWPQTYKCFVLASWKVFYITACDCNNGFEVHGNRLPGAVASRFFAVRLPFPIRHLTSLSTFCRYCKWR